MCSSCWSTSDDGACFCKPDARHKLAIANHTGEFCYQPPTVECVRCKLAICVCVFGAIKAYRVTRADWQKKMSVRVPDSGELATVQSCSSNRVAADYFDIVHVELSKQSYRWVDLMLLYFAITSSGQRVYVSCKRLLLAMLPWYLSLAVSCSTLFVCFNVDNKYYRAAHGLPLRRDEWDYILCVVLLRCTECSCIDVMTY